MREGGPRKKTAAVCGDVHRKTELRRWGLARRTYCARATCVACRNADATVPRAGRTAIASGRRGNARRRIGNRCARFGSASSPPSAPIRERVDCKVGAGGGCVPNHFFHSSFPQEWTSFCESVAHLNERPTERSYVTALSDFGAPVCLSVRCPALRTIAREDRVQFLPPRRGSPFVRPAA